jgi:secreted Zn-dependent insulinase-like peptidase
VIGHEGPNSLLSLLIKNGLVTALSCGNNNRLNNQKAGISIVITLTEKGVSEWK